jgi:hypothetical protein
MSLRNQILEPSCTIGDSSMLGLPQEKRGKRKLNVRNCKVNIL